MQRRKRGGHSVHSSEVLSRVYLTTGKGGEHEEHVPALGVRRHYQGFEHRRNPHQRGKEITIPVCGEDSSDHSRALHAQHRLFEGLPAHAVASVVADPGFEFAHLYKLGDALGIPTYFCDPYSSWQRATNEHLNGRIRRYIPRKNPVRYVHPARARRLGPRD